MVDLVLHRVPNKEGILKIKGDPILSLSELLGVVTKCSDLWPEYKPDMSIRTCITQSIKSFVDMGLDDVNTNLTKDKDVGKEFLMAMHSIRPHGVIRLLYSFDALKIYIPSLDKIDKIAQEKKKCVNLFKHSWQTLYYCVMHTGFSGHVATKMACLLHDVGKDRAGSFIGHEKRSSNLARRDLERLGIDKEIIDDTCLLILYHMRPHQYQRSGSWRRGTVKRFRDLLGSLASDAVVVAIADKLASQGRNLEFIEPYFSLLGRLGKEK